MDANVSSYENSLEKVFEIGERALENTSGEEAKEIGDELTDLRTVWYQLSTLLTDRRDKIASVEPLAIKYHQALQKLAQVMSKTEVTLEELKYIGAEMRKIEEELGIVQVRFRIYINIYLLNISYLQNIIYIYIYIYTLNTIYIL